MHLDDEELAFYVEAVIAEFGGVRQAAREYMEADINAGHLTLARQGKGSRMIRRSWKIPEHPQRERLIISMSPARFNTQRGKVSRADWLVELMDLMDDHLDGIGEII